MVDTEASPGKPSEAYGDGETADSGRGGHGVRCDDHEHHLRQECCEERGGRKMLAMS